MADIRHKLANGLTESDHKNKMRNTANGFSIKM